LSSQTATSAADIDHLREIHRLKNELTHSEGSNKTLTAKVKELSALLMGAEEVSSKLNAANAQLEIEVNELKTALKKAEDESKHAVELAIVERKRIESLEEHLKLAMSERDRNAVSLSKKDSELSHSKTKVGSLEAESKILTARVEELARKLLIESENNKKAMEKAITGSVRLCVVAPTVNVHVADKKLKFKSGLSESSLKDFLKAEVLDKYSFLYKQKSENSAPNGSNLESWLQKMLAQMQTSIQNHVTSAMDGGEI